MSLDRVPVIIGVGQCTVRDQALDALSSPLDLMESAATAAAPEFART